MGNDRIKDDRWAELESDPALEEPSPSTKAVATQPRVERKPEEEIEEDNAEAEAAPAPQGVGEAHGQPAEEEPVDEAEAAEEAQKADVPATVFEHRWWILVGLIMAAALEILDTTVVNVSLPQMAGNLNASTDEIAWVSTGYLLSNVIVLPMTAWLSGRFGRKRYLIASILIFNIARFMCGLSGSLGAVVFWRLIQGAGGAALISTAQSTLVEIFPRKQVAMVQALFSLGLVVTPTIGPAIGGYITDNYSWRMVFFVHVPLAIGCLLIVALFLQDSLHQKRVNEVDFIGIGLLATGMGSLQYVLEEGERYDWFGDAWITRLSIIAVVATVGFVWWELSPRNKVPVLDLHVLKDRGLAAAVVLGLVIGFGLYGGVFIYPLFVQNILGFTPTETGMILIPGGIATACGVIFCGRVLQRGWDPRWLITAGMLIYTVAMWMLGHLTLQSGASDTQVGLIVRGLGLGLIFVPITTAAFAGLHGADIAHGAALYNLMRQLGGSFGIAILNTYVVSMTAYHRYNLVGNLYPGNPELLARLGGITHTLIGFGLTSAEAQAGALRMLDRTITVQAITMAYNDAFLLLGIASLITLPAVLLLRRPRGHAGPSAGAH